MRIDRDHIVKPSLPVSTKCVGQYSAIATDECPCITCICRYIDTDLRKTGTRATDAGHSHIYTIGCRWCHSYLYSSDRGRKSSIAHVAECIAPIIGYDEISTRIKTCILAHRCKNIIAVTAEFDICCSIVARREAADWCRGSAYLRPGQPSVQTVLEPGRIAIVRQCHIDVLRIGGVDGYTVYHTPCRIVRYGRWHSRWQYGILVIAIEEVQAIAY